MISPVLFYHQDHPLKVDAAPTVVVVLSIEATFIRNSFLCRAAHRLAPEHAAQITPFGGYGGQFNGQSQRNDYHQPEP